MGLVVFWGCLGLFVVFGCCLLFFGVVWGFLLLIGAAWVKVASCCVAVFEFACLVSRLKADCFG